MIDGGSQSAELLRFLQPDEDGNALINRLLSFDLKAGIQILDIISAVRKGSAIEILGPMQTGKSILCMKVALRFILPEVWEGIRIGGLGGTAFYVDADLRFDFIQFLYLAQSHLRDVLPPTLQGLVHEGSSLMQDMLSRFTLVSVESSQDALDALQHVIATSPAQGPAPQLLVLDSAAAFLEVERARGLDALFLPDPATAAAPLGIADVHARMAALVDTACSQGSVVVVAARAAVQFEDAGIECKGSLPTPWKEVITGRLALYRELEEAEATSGQQVARWLQPRQQLHYLLQADGTCTPVK